MLLLLLLIGLFPKLRVLLEFGVNVVDSTLMIVIVVFESTEVFFVLFDVYKFFD